MDSSSRDRGGSFWRLISSKSRAVRFAPDARTRIAHYKIRGQTPVRSRSFPPAETRQLAEPARHQPSSDVISISAIGHHQLVHSAIRVDAGSLDTVAAPRHDHHVANLPSGHQSAIAQRDLPVMKARMVFGLAAPSRAKCADSPRTSMSTRTPGGTSARHIRAALWAWRPASRVIGRRTPLSEGVQERVLRSGKRRGDRRHVHCSAPRDSSVRPAFRRFSRSTTEFPCTASFSLLCS